MEKLNLDGIYTRQLNMDTGKYENICFTDLTDEQRSKFIKSLDPDGLRQTEMHLMDAYVQMHLDEELPKLIEDTVRNILRFAIINGIRGKDVDDE